MIRFFLSIAVVLVATFSSMAQAVHTIEQNQEDYILFEAESFSNRQDPASSQAPRWQLVNDGGTISVGANRDGFFPIEDYSAAKLAYYIEVKQTGWYYLYVRRKVKTNRATFVVPRIDEAVSSNVRRRVICNAVDTSYQWQNGSKSFFLEAGRTYSLFLLPENSKDLLLDQLLLHRDNALTPAALAQADLKSCDFGNQSISALLRYWAPETGFPNAWKIASLEGGSTVDTTRFSGHLPYSGKSFIELQRAEGQSLLVMDTIDYSRCLLPISALNFRFRVMSPEGWEGDNDTLRVYAILKGLNPQLIALGEITSDVTKAYQSFEFSAPWNNAFYNKVVFAVDYQGDGAERLWIDDLGVQFVSPIAYSPLIPPADMDIIADTILLGALDYTFSLQGGITDTMIKRSTFIWNFNDEFSRVNVSKDTFRYVFKAPGFYTIALTVQTKATHDSYCDSITTVIKKLVYVAAPASANPVRGQSILVPFTVRPTVAFNVFPNPTTAEFQLQVADPVAVLRYELYDLRGQRLAANAFSGQATLSLREQPSGTYLVRVYDQQGVALFTRQVVKH